MTTWRATGVEERHKAMKPGSGVQSSHLLFHLPAALQVVAALGLILAKLLREGVAPLR